MNGWLELDWIFGDCKVYKFPLELDGAFYLIVVIIRTLMEILCSTRLSYYLSNSKLTLRHIIYEHQELPPLSTQKEWRLGRWTYLQGWHLNFRNLNVPQWLGHCSEFPENPTTVIRPAMTMGWSTDVLPSHVLDGVKRSSETEWEFSEKGTGRTFLLHGTDSTLGLGHRFCGLFHRTFCVFGIQCLLSVGQFLKVLVKLPVSSWFGKYRQRENNWRQ